MSRSILLAGLALCPLLAEAQVQVSVALGANEAHTTTITNREVRRLTKVQLTVLPNADAVWDQFDRVSGPAFTVAPVVGTNADGVKAQTIELATLVDQNQTLTAQGDIDSMLGITGVSVTVTWENGVVGTASLQKNGTTWAASVPPGAAVSPGEPAQLSWEAPTQNVDSSPYVNPAGYRVYWGVQSGVHPNSASVPNPNQLAYEVTGLVANTRYFFAVTAINATNDESAKSAEATLVPGLLTPDPKPPVGLVATGPTAINAAYTISTVPNATVLNYVGTVALGTPCDGTQRLNAWGDRPDDMADLYLIVLGTPGLVLLPGVQPDVVYARCAN